MLPAGLPFPDIGTDLFSFDIGGVTFALRWYALAYIFGILIPVYSSKSMGAGCVRLKAP